METKIPATFITYAAGILAATDEGLKGNRILDYTAGYAFDYNVELPYSSYPFAGAPNKRSALKDNLLALPGEAQYLVLKDMCDDAKLSENSAVKDLKIKLISRFGSQFGGSGSDNISEPLVQETKHWLEDYDAAYRAYISAEQKYRGGVFSRNLLDDLRLSLELLLKQVLQNEKSLENQIASLGSFLSQKGGSKELSNMFLKLFDYFCKYQNTFVKHNDAVIEEEIEIVFELSSSFIKHVIRLHETVRSQAKDTK